MRRNIIMVVALVMVLGAAMPALAHTANVSANCGGGGFFYSKATVATEQVHFHDSSSQSFEYSGVQTKTASWGFHSGNQGATIDSPNTITNPTALCPT